MQTDHARGRLVGHILGYRRTPVTTLDAVLGIAQTIHQNDKSLCHTLWAPATGSGGSGKSKARK